MSVAIAQYVVCTRAHTHTHTHTHTHKHTHTQNTLLRLKFGTYFGTYLGTYFGTHFGTYFGTYFGTNFGTYFARNLAHTLAHNLARLLILFLLPMKDVFPGQKVVCACSWFVPAHAAKQVTQPNYISTCLVVSLWTQPNKLRRRSVCYMVVFSWSKTGLCLLMVCACSCRHKTPSHTH